MENTLERLSRRLPGWARGRSRAADRRRRGGRRRWSSCSRSAARRRRREGRRPGAGRRCRRRRHRRPRAVGRGRAARCASSPPAIDSLDPQRSYLPGVWNLMRLYTRTLVTYAAEARAHRRPRARPGHRPRARSPDGGLTWTFTLKQRRHVRERPADHLPGRQVRHRALVRLRRRRRRPHLRRRPARRPRRTPTRARTRTRPRTSWAWRRSRRPTTRTIVFHLRRPAPDFPYVLALPSSSPVPIEADTGAGYGARPGLLGAVRDHLGRPARPGSCSTATRTGTRRTDEVRTALPDRVVVRTGLTGLERDQALLAGSADVDISGAGVQPATTARLADEDATTPLLQTGSTTSPPARCGCWPCPPTWRRWTTPTAARPWRRSSTGRRCRSALGGAGDAVRSSQLWPRGLPGGPRRARPAARPRRGPGGAGRLRPAGRVHHRAGRAPTCPAASTLATRARRPAGRVGIEVEVQAAGRRPPSTPPTSATRTTSRPSGYGIVLATWTADFPTPASFLGPAGRRPQHPGGRQHELRAAERPRTSTR